MDVYSFRSNINLIFLAYANSSDKPQLEHLVEEQKKVDSLLSVRMARHDFTFVSDPNAKLEKVIERLIRFKEDICVFGFSGHAGRDQLVFEDQEGKGDGIADLLAKCPNLRLVLLNGCSTVGQVKRLLQLPNGPAIISTSTAVGDRAAAQFAISFFQALSEQDHTVQEAYEIALAAARAVAKAEIEVQEDRILVFREDTKAEDPLWGIDVRAETEKRNKLWKFPKSSKNQFRPASKIHLIDRKDQNDRLLQYRHGNDGILAGVLYGHYQDCPHLYPKCLESRLPFILNPNGEKKVTKSISIPLATRYSNYSTLKQGIIHELERETNEPSLTEATRKLYEKNKSKHILFYSIQELTVDNASYIQELVRNYLRFWKEIPARGGKYRIVALGAAPI